MPPWVSTFQHWAKSGNSILLLCQDKTDTDWFKNAYWSSDFMVFLTGRVNFIGTQTGNMHGATVFGWNLTWDGDLFWDWRNEL